MHKRSIRTDKYNKIINILIQQRLKNNLTQTQVANELDRPQSYVAKYELCQRRLDVVEFMDVCEVLGLRPSKVMILTQ